MSSTTPISSVPSATPVLQPKLHAVRRGLFIAFIAVLFGIGGWYLSYDWKMMLGAIGNNVGQTIGLLVVIVVGAALIGWSIVSDSKRSTIGGIFAGALIVAAGFIFANQFNIWTALIVIGVIVLLPVLFVAAHYTGDLKELPNSVSDGYKSVSQAYNQRRAERYARNAAAFTALEELQQISSTQQPLVAVPQPQAASSGGA